MITLGSYIEERGCVNAQILFTNCQYIKKFGLVGIICKYAQFGFQIVIYHLSSILINNYKNIFPPV